MSYEPRVSEVSGAVDISGSVDGFSIFRDSIAVRGWCLSRGSPVAELEIRFPGFPEQGGARRVSPFWLPSPDVAAVHGAAAGQCRFDFVVSMPPFAPSACGGSLAVVLADGSVAALGPLGGYRPSAASALTERFHGMLAQMPAPDVLEIGARARSGITRRDRMPVGARYVGCDILAGENVDVVCDAHALSAMLPQGKFDAVMAFSVLEHLLMPWKMVLEMNKVMAPGGIGLFTTHQAWPIHDAPWDYWRFSDRAWAGLLNPATGFEILEAAMGEPAYIIAADCHAVTNFPREPSAFLASNVLFRKIGETALSWDVDPASLVTEAYPA